MKARKSGSRHPLLFYRRTMDRVWRTTLLLAVILLALWGWAWSTPTSVFSGGDVWLLGGAIVVLALSVFAFAARYMAYVQAHFNHFTVVTPFLRLKVSYRRVRSTHPVLVQQLFPKDETRWSQRKFLEPFYGKTVVVAVLRGYPINPILLRLFLPAQMFSPRSDGLVFMVPDWMAFSTELDSFRGAWLQLHSRRS